jgi:hypothetical protein
MARKKLKKKKRLLNIPKEYIEAIEVGEPIFSTLFQFENGLRIYIHNYLVTCYGTDWWEVSLKTKKLDIYKYVQDQELKKNYMPWIGDSTRINVLPIHSITLGQLEQIVIAYKSECIPQLFPSLDFFKGHLEIIKRVRNLFAHFHPCITPRDVTTAKREVLTMIEHIKGKDLSF